MLAHTAAKYALAEDYPHGWAPEVADQLLHMVEDLWGTEGFVSIAAPSRSQDDGFRQRYGRYLRAADPEEDPIVGRHVNWPVPNVMEFTQMVIDDPLDELEETPSENHLT